MFSFDSLSVSSFLVEENEFYKLYHNTDALFMYDYNFMQLKFQPTLEEFKILEDIQLDFHSYHNVEHLKFYWPENTGFTEPLISYFNRKNYGIETLELYVLNPNDFHTTKRNQDVSISTVSDQTLQDYQSFNYQIDLNVSPLFAKKKQQLYQENFYRTDLQQVTARLNGEVVGTVDLIYSEKTVEIDNFTVGDLFQKQGIGSELQYYVLTQANEKAVILAADADDTAREMYAAQGYRYFGYRLGIQKELSFQK
ncbi:MAG: GNAT family N-acetyltransferase [Pisciglobus halotolerans]|nr:GNAT family N-acetyltransferase [Pisciglobus halotolerans]